MPPGHCRVPFGTLVPSLPLPCALGSQGSSRDRAAGLAFTLPGATHVLRHPAHRAEQGGQVGAGHLTTHEVLQVWGPCPRPWGGPGLQVQDLGFKSLQEEKQGEEGRDGEMDRHEGGGEEAPWVGSPCPAGCPHGSLGRGQCPGPGRACGWETGFCYVRPPAAVPAVPGTVFWAVPPGPTATPRQPDFPAAGQKVPLATARVGVSPAPPCSEVRRLRLLLSDAEPWGLASRVRSSTSAGRPATRVLGLHSPRAT